LSDERSVRGLVSGSSNAEQIMRIFREISDHHHEDDISELVAGSLAGPGPRYVPFQTDSQFDDHQMALALARSVRETQARGHLDPQHLADFAGDDDETLAAIIAATMDDGEVPVLPVHVDGVAGARASGAQRPTAAGPRPSATHEPGMTYEELLQLEDVQEGLTLKEIDSFPLLIYGETAPLPSSPGKEAGSAEACVICMEEIKYGSVVRQLPCSHWQFCADCIDDWLRRSKRCPICKEWLR
jgi:hypothetical protein